jgi:hypothetical protein
LHLSASEEQQDVQVCRYQHQCEHVDQGVGFVAGADLHLHFEQGQEVIVIVIVVEYGMGLLVNANVRCLQDLCLHLHFEQGQEEIVIVVEYGTGLRVKASVHHLQDSCLTETVQAYCGGVAAEDVETLMRLVYACIMI